METGDNTVYLQSQIAVDAETIEAQIATFKSRLSIEQRNLRSRLRQQLNPLRSPAYRLSDDLWMCIFELAAAGCQDLRFAFVVSHVAARWRRVALSTPRLWSIIRIKLPYNAGKTKSEAVDTVMERSGAAPLHSLIVSSTDVEYGLQVLGPTEFRLSTLSPSVAELVSRLLSRSETAYLVAISLSNITFQLTSRLRRLCIQFPFARPWSGYPFQAFLDALEPCANLEYLSLARLHCNETDRRHPVAVEDQRPSHNISLPALLTVHIEDFIGYPEFPIHTILQGIDANLTHLSIRAPNHAPMGFPYHHRDVKHLTISSEMDWLRWFPSQSLVDGTSSCGVRVLQLCRLPRSSVIIEVPQELVASFSNLNSIIDVDELIFDSCEGPFTTKTENTTWFLCTDATLKARQVRVIPHGQGHDLIRHRDRVGLCS